ncbi:hypothetical protein SG34_022020 [Thalassomonas viridans]|uniref:FHA domain-containing protein n=1 Tax=Thalassomonas viridans TaxID=137584 RepID=A0AAE9YZT6_9GAMM|nr:hypothetical protein [Thalassomonas viridans]WDE04015.1 hypothetical protein SG34_022020 [Thalassomonas viridans]
MALTLIEINDHQLTIRQGEKSWSQSGYALIDKERLLFGQDAFNRGKLDPGNFYCRYWQQLGYEEITTDNPQIRHFADLAYLQLKALLAQCDHTGDTIFMVPANYSQQQLSLLLGIAGSCRLKVIAVINEAVIKLAHHQQAGKLALLDIGLHHCSLSELHAAQDLSLITPHAIPHKGLHDLYKHLAAWLNEKFILECRYDIFATAQAEQAIYNYLPEIIPCLRPSYQLKVSDKTLKVFAGEIKEQIKTFFAPVLASAGEYANIYITPRLKAVLATEPALEAMALADESTLHQNIHRHLNELTGNKQISLITRLPLNLKARPYNADISLQKQSEATHLAYKGHAYPLTEKTLFLYGGSDNPLSLNSGENYAAKLTRTDRSWQLDLACGQPRENPQPVLINNHPARHQQRLYPGDKIKIGREEASFLLLKVEKELH